MFGKYWGFFEGKKVHLSQTPSSDHTLNMFQLNNINQLIEYTHQLIIECKLQAAVKQKFR